MKRLVGMKHVPKICLAGAIVMLITAPWGAETSGKERGRHRDTRSGVERQSARLHAIMLPLLRNTDRRLPLDQVRVSIVDDPEINAGSGGNGEFFVTTGLLNQATDEQLRGVLAHEVAHEDLGHPMKAQVIGAGLSIGVALLEQLFPGSSSFTPIAGTLISNNYTRPLELEADRHAVTLLERAGYGKRTMIDTLTWLLRRSGDSGGFLSSHPATSERIHALQSLR